MAEISKNKPKILIFSLAYAPFIGGAEIAVQEITKHLGGDFEFDLITCNFDGQQKNEEQIEGVKIYRVGKGTFGKYFFPWLAYKKAVFLCHPRINDDPVKKASYNIIWSIMANQAGWAVLKFKEKFPAVKYLLTLQEGDPISHVYRRTWFWFWRYKKIYQKADHIQVISKWLAQRARRFGYQKEITLVPNGVGLVVDKQNNNPVKIILTVSRLVKKNGIADLIKAFYLLVNRDPILKIKLIIVGDGSLRGRLEKLVDDLKLSNKVEFIGHISPLKTNDYYTKADIFIRPSLSEGFGISFIEAMAAGVPVIATPVGGIPDFLKEGETGWFCEPQKPANLAEKMKYILDEKNKNEVTRVVENAKKMVKEKYTWEIVASQMKIIFNKLL